jgi:hypothetical protein
VSSFDSSTKHPDNGSLDGKNDVVNGLHAVLLSNLL